MAGDEGQWLDEDTTCCRLCGEPLTAENCDWARFPGICEDCAPPGLSTRLPWQRSSGFPLPHPPRGFSLMHQCDCGRLVPKWRRMCDACRDKARTKTYQKKYRRLRREKRRRKGKWSWGETASGSD